MAYVIGIDTGGTYTDAVLLDTNKQCPEGIVSKSKAFTTHDQLSCGIREAIMNLHINSSELTRIEKVVLSTTLATNAIVENNTSKVGLLLLGETPKGKLATDIYAQVPGKLNIKGRILVNTDREETQRTLMQMLPHVDAIAISGGSSVRNPVLEKNIKKIVEENCSLPVMCGHEFANELGFLDRTNTVVINAGLLPVINDFIEAIKEVLTEMSITAPVFVVKADGSTSTMESIRQKPIDTVLSGPAASMAGAASLTGLENAIVSDMGGTTTDTGVIRGRRVELSKTGAEVGGWRIKVKSAKLYTFGLGGDSTIENAGEDFKIGPKRVLPACRNGKNTLTPTDILHYTREFVQWDYEKSEKAIKQRGTEKGITSDEYVSDAVKAITKKIYEENICFYEKLGFPVCAIGAPAKSWYTKASDEYGFELVIPESFEVANAVGAATAGIREEVEAVVRPGEEGHGYLAHTEEGRFWERKKADAVNKAIRVSIQHAEKLIIEQNLELDDVTTSCKDVFNNKGKLLYIDIDPCAVGGGVTHADSTNGTYIETRIKISAGGKIFSDSNSAK